MPSIEKMTACVTGGNGFIASALIKQLLEKGYAVRTTVRNPENTAKILHLKQLQQPKGDGAGGELAILGADLAVEGSFDEAVAGCDYVFLVAAPVNMAAPDPENELIKPAVQGTLNVLRSCVKAKVRRVILTSSAAAVSVNKLQGSGHVMDENNWSDITFLTTEKPPSWGYAASKVLLEREAAAFGEENKLSIVTVLPALTVGPALGSDLNLSLMLSLSLLSGNYQLLDFVHYTHLMGKMSDTISLVECTGNADLINVFRMMQSVSGSISMTHLDDMCRAHIFVAETESAAGRYICCAANTSLPELARFLSERYPQYQVPTDFSDVPEKPKLVLSSEKLKREGFEFKYKQLEEIYYDTVRYAEASGLLAPKVNQ